MGYGDGAFTWIGHTLLTIVSGLFLLLGLLVAVAVVVLLVRFLLVATKAAQIYVAKNSAETHVEPVQPAATTVAETPPPAATVTKPVVKPATKPRTPKTPPTA